MQCVNQVRAALLLAAGLGSLAHAQLIGSVSVSPSTVMAGTPVTVTANVDVVGGNYCGFAVFYGDGRNVESFSDIKQPTPFVSTHVYDKPGTYTISMGGRHVESHPNCGGPDKFATVTVTEAPKPMAVAPAPAPAMVAVAQTMPANAKTMGKTSMQPEVCHAPWKLVPKTFNAKTRAYTCVAALGTPLPEPRPGCSQELTYFENAKKGQFGCKP